MLPVLAAIGLSLLALPRLAHPLGRRLHPAEWARLCLVAVVGGALVVETAAFLLAATLCERLLRDQVPGGAATVWAAAGVAVALPALGGMGWARARSTTRRARIEGWLGRHHDHDDRRLVVLPTARLIAISVPGRRPLLPDQIVVSEGLVDTLAPGELDAILGHEVAHLRHRHHLYLSAAAAVDQALGWFPLARRSTATLRVALERWADEEAAATAGDRGVVRDALLSVTATLVAAPSLAAFSAAETIGERLDALEADAPRLPLVSRLMLYVPGAVLVATGLVAWSSWAGETGRILAMAAQCFI